MLSPAWRSLLPMRAWIHLKLKLWKLSFKVWKLQTYLFLTWENVNFLNIGLGLGFSRTRAKNNTGRGLSIVSETLAFGSQVENTNKNLKNVSQPSCFAFLLLTRSFYAFKTKTWISRPLKWPLYWFQRAMHDGWHTFFICLITNHKIFLYSVGTLKNNNGKLSCSIKRLRNEGTNWRRCYCRRVSICWFLNRWNGQWGQTAVQHGALSQQTSIDWLYSVYSLYCGIASNHQKKFRDGLKRWSKDREGE